MYTIGEFSKINRITTKTLRHYDKIDLLKPVKIDPWTGYRYYDASQLSVIKKILILKDFGLSLEEIKTIVIENKDPIPLLDQRLKNIEEDIRNSKLKLENLKRFIKGEGEDMKEIIIKSLPKVIVASMRTTIPSYDTYFDIVPKMGEYMIEVGAKVLEPAYCFTIYHDGEYKERDIDVEVCEAVISMCKESDKIKFKQIDHVPMAACLFHNGPYSTIKSSYNEIFNLINKNGYEVVGNPRESYIDGIWNKDDPKEWLTEIQVPVKQL